MPSQPYARRYRLSRRLQSLHTMPLSVQPLRASKTATEGSFDLAIVAVVEAKALPSIVVQAHGEQGIIMVEPAQQLDTSQNASR